MDSFFGKLLDLGFDCKKEDETFYVNKTGKSVENVMALLCGLAYFEVNDNTIIVPFGELGNDEEESEEDEEIIQQKKEILVDDIIKKAVELSNKDCMIALGKYYQSVTTKRSLLENIKKYYEDHLDKEGIYGFKLDFNEDNELEVYNGRVYACIEIEDDIMTIDYGIKCITIKNVKSTFENQEGWLFKNLFDIIKIGFKYQVTVNPVACLREITIDISCDKKGMPEIEKHTYVCKNVMDGNYWGRKYRLLKSGELFNDLML